MERQAKGGRPGMPPFNNQSNQIRTTQRMPQMNNFMHSPQQYQQYEMCPPTAAAQVGCAPVVPRNYYHLPYHTPTPGYYCNPMFPNQLISSPSSLHQPLTYNSGMYHPHSNPNAGTDCLPPPMVASVPPNNAGKSGGHPGGSSGPSSVGGLPPSGSVVPNLGGGVPGMKQPEQQQQQVVNPTSTMAAAPPRRRSKAIEIVNPLTMQPVSLEKEEGDSEPSATDSHSSKKSAGAIISEPPTRSSVVITAPPQITPASLGAQTPSSQTTIDSSSSVSLSSSSTTTASPTTATASAKTSNNNVDSIDSSAVVNSVEKEIVLKKEEKEPALSKEEEMSSREDAASPEKPTVASANVEEEEEANRKKEEEANRKKEEEPETIPPAKSDSSPKVDEPVVVEVSSEQTAGNEVVIPSPQTKKNESEIVEESPVSVEPTGSVVEKQQERSPSSVSGDVAVVPPKKESTPIHDTSSKVIDIPSEDSAVASEASGLSCSSSSAPSTTSDSSLISSDTGATGSTEESVSSDQDEPITAAPEAVVVESPSPSIVLKYDYKPDQWSPLNPSGKRQYDSAFLKLIQSSPLALSKPGNLPLLEIIKSEPIEHHRLASVTGGLKDATDFMPSFSSSHGSIVKSSSRNSITKRTSREGRPRMNAPGPSGPGNYMLSGTRSLSNAPLPERVELRTTDNPWRPSMDKPIEAIRGIDTEFELDSMEDQRKKVMAILNKLTPQKFDNLLETFNSIKMDSEQKLSQAIDLIFEKAIDEPNYSVAYARMCEVLQTKTVAETKFKTIILTKCQQEFEKAYMQPEEKEKYLQDLEAAKSESEKKSIKGDFMARELRARRRSLGNVRFIGEIFKRNLLTLHIIHGCIGNLLKSQDEESLESLCRLLTTVGKKVQSDTEGHFKGGKVDNRVRSMDQYFNVIQDIVDNRPSRMGAPKTTISNRIRFMLQDIIDLRKRNWVPRRDVAGPKTLEQIHQDVAREKKAEALSNMSQQSSGGMSSSGRGNSGRSSNSSNSMMNNKRSSFRGMNNSSNGHHHHGGGNDRHYDDGMNWSSSGGSSSKKEIFNSDYLLNINKAPINYDNMKLGPNTTHSWNKGSTSSGGLRSGGSMGLKDSSPVIKSTNRFSSLNTDNAFDGGSGSTSSSSISKSTSLNRNAGRLDFPRSEGRSYSRSMRAGNAGGSGSWLAPKLRGPSNLDKSFVEDLSLQIFSKFVLNNNMDEAISTIKKELHANCMKSMLEALIEGELDSKESRRELLRTFIEGLIKEEIIQTSDCKEVVSTFIGLSSDYLSDIPFYWNNFVSIIAIMYIPSTSVDKSTSSSSSCSSSSSGFLFLRDAFDTLSEPGPSEYFLRSLLKHLKSSPSLGESGTRRLFNLAMSSASSQSTSAVKEAIQSAKELEFLLLSAEDESTGHSRKKEECSSASLTKDDESKKGLTTTTTTNATAATGAQDKEVSSKEEHELEEKNSPEGRRKKLASLFKANASNQVVLDWTRCVDPKISSEKCFIRSVITECALSTIIKPDNELNPSAFEARLPFLEEFLGSSSSAQLQALFAIQKLVKDLTYPPGLLTHLISMLSGFIKEEVFRSWKSDKSASEQEGKGICMSTLSRFFDAIEEGEE